MGMKSESETGTKSTLKQSFVSIQREHTNAFLGRLSRFSIELIKVPTDTMKREGKENDEKLECGPRPRR